jgi:aspartyl-tRNA(Asn)/glutamyl-tRNA(Gln) amidotransferase subunit B
LIACWSPTARFPAPSPSRSSRSCSKTGDARRQDRRGARPEADVSDTGAIEAAIAKVLADNADKVEQYRGGKEALFGFFVGQTMKAMQGKANPQLVNEQLKKMLN